MPTSLRRRQGIGQRGDIVVGCGAAGIQGDSGIHEDDAGGRGAGLQSIGEMVGKGVQADRGRERRPVQTRLGARRRVLRRIATDFPQRLKLICDRFLEYPVACSLMFLVTRFLEVLSQTKWKLKCECFEKIRR